MGVSLAGRGRVGRQRSKPPPRHICTATGGAGVELAHPHPFASSNYKPALIVIHTRFHQVRSCRRVLMALRESLWPCGFMCSASWRLPSFPAARVHRQRASWAAWFFPYTHFSERASLSMTPGEGFFSERGKSWHPKNFAPIFPSSLSPKSTSYP